MNFNSTQLDNREVHKMQNAHKSNLDKHYIAYRNRDSQSGDTIMVQSLGEVQNRRSFLATRCMQRDSEVQDTNSFPD